MNDTVKSNADHMNENCTEEDVENGLRGHPAVSLLLLFQIDHGGQKGSLAAAMTKVGHAGLSWGDIESFGFDTSLF